MLEAEPHLAGGDVGQTATEQLRNQPPCRLRQTASHQRVSMLQYRATSNGIYLLLYAQQAAPMR